MASSINASTAGSGGVITTADNSGVLNIQTAGTTAVTIDTSQNVGIGTSSPSTQLELSAATPVITVNQTTINSDTGLKFKYSGTTVFAQVTGNASTGEMKFISGQSGQNGYYQTFATNGSERMRIDSSGNVFINKTSTTANGKLEMSFSGNGYVSVNTDTGGTARNDIYFVRNGSNVGAIQTTSVATAYTSVSDYRLKENILPMTGALAKIFQLKPVIYKWKANGLNGQGFIAHELQAVIPDCVNGEKDAVDDEGKPVYQGIDTSFLVATLTAAIQEQQALITQLQADVAALKGAK